MNEDNFNLVNIQVNYVKNLLLFFTKKYVDGELKSLDMIICNVKTISNCVGDIKYRFDVSLWYNKLEDFENQIEFCFNINYGKTYGVRFYLSEIDKYIKKELEIINI